MPGIFGTCASGPAFSGIDSTRRRALRHETRKAASEEKMKRELEVNGEPILAPMFY